MDLLVAIIMGIVQGLSEFLPISSSAHLRLVPVALHFYDPGAGFTAVIQIGTVVAVVIYFWKDLAAAFKAWARSITDRDSRPTPEARMGWAVFVGTLPVIIVGVALRHQIKSESLRSLYVVAASMIGMAIIMWVAEIYGRKSRKLKDVTATDGLLPGVLQCLALIPGMSRSGSTITGAFFEGFDREAATRFSFLMSVPSVLGAGVFELFEARKELSASGVGFVATAVATVVSFVVGYATIKFLISWISKHGISIFVWYRLALGILLLVLLQQGIIHPMTGEGDERPAAAAAPR